MSGVRKYFSLFRIRFNAGLQYRTAAFGGIACQLAWGIMTILMFRAFYQADSSAFPMTLEQVSAYTWLRQAFLSLLMLWNFDQQIFDSITSGNVAYELARPLDLYSMWFSKTVSKRLANCVLRCVPVIVISVLIPSPYGLSVPINIQTFIGFLLSMIMGLFLVCGIAMIVYALSFFTMQPRGIMYIIGPLSEFLSGNIVPLPFYPEKLRKILEISPFGSISNMPFRIYSGSIGQEEIIRCLFIQLMWLVIVVALGSMLLNKALKRTVIQGG